MTNASDGTVPTDTATPADDFTPAEVLTELVGALGVTAAGDDRFTGEAPDWFGDRVFGGLVVGQGLAAACATVDGPMRAHSMHAYFLGAMRPGPVEWQVDRLRDGRTFSTRHVRSEQHGRTATWLTVSFHADEEGVPYQLAMPSDLPEPESVERSVDAPPPFDMRELGPTDQRADGTYESTRRCWIRPVVELPADPSTHLLLAGYLSDLTGTSFRPHNLGEWGTHSDASIDHAVWFHRTPCFDDWWFMDFHTLINHGGRSAVRGAVFDRAGQLVLTMAQELLIRPLDPVVP